MDSMKPRRSDDDAQLAVDGLTQSSQARGATVVDDRRAEPRMSRKAAVVMAFGPGLHDGFEHATLIDCSRHGVGLLLDHPLAPGAHLFLKLKLAITSLAVYEVKHCERGEVGYQVGAEFRHIVGTDDMSDAMADRVHDALLQLPPVSPKA